jgi:DNA-nicking Smr family endonuclease
MSGKKPRPGDLAPEDRALWAEVQKSIRPLRRQAVEVAAVPDDKPDRAASRAAPVRPAPPPRPKGPPPLAKLDRRARNRVARGRVEIDARLDLHGLTLARARERLHGFLQSAQLHGDRLILVITGKGSAGGEGALRREAPHWLALPEFRDLVVGFEEAAPNHGGSGALYVRVRRPRDQRM